MNITGTTNRTPVITTRSKSSNAQAAENLKQSNFEDALQKSLAAKYSKDAFIGTSDVKRTSTKIAASSISDTQAKLDSISRAIKNTDYSEMSKAEIYADIEKKYADTFDDFYLTLAVLPSEDHIIMYQQFQQDVNDHIERPRSHNIVLEARGYSGMSYDEIEASIKEKYAGKTGFIDQLNLLGELFSSGVLPNKLGWTESIFFVGDLENSIRCGYDGRISKSDWLFVIEETGASSPFSLLLNSPYYADLKEMYQSIVDDILFGIADRAK